MDRLRSPNVINRVLAPAVLGGVVLTAAGCHALVTSEAHAYIACPGSTHAELTKQQIVRGSKALVTLSGRVACKSPATPDTSERPIRLATKPFPAETDELDISGTSTEQQHPDIKVVDHSDNIHTVGFYSIDNVDFSANPQ